MPTSCGSCWRQALRVALLTLMEPAGVDGSAPRGLLRVGGATLARHQLALALSAGCQRIACLARGIGPDLIELQHEAEKAGASFHVIGGAHGLSGLVTAADEVMVLAEGLLPTAGDALRLIDGPPAVLVQPSETGVPAGYERIDLNHASAGLMIVPGRLADRLMELPGDSDPGSALMRIALQAGVAQRPVPDEVRLGGRWLLVRSEAEAHDAEEGWMARQTAGGARTPGPLLARTLVRQFGPALLHGGRSSLIGAGTAVVLAALGLALAWFGWGAPGLLLAGAGWVLQRASTMLDRVRREALAQRAGPLWRSGVFDLGFDAVIAAILVIAVPALPGQLVIERCFAPAMLIGLLRLLPRGFTSGWSVWAEDRLTLTVLLAAMFAGKVIQPGVPALAALLLLAGLVLSREGNGQRLTRA